MQGNEALAFDSLRGWLQTTLYTVVKDLVDQLVSNGVFSGDESPDSAVAKICSEHLERHEQVDELLRQLIALPGKPGLHPFKEFCKVTRGMDRSNVAERLEFEAEKHLERSGRYADVENCALVVAGLTFEQQLARTIGEYQRRTRSSPKQRQEAGVDRLHSHLRSRCKHLSTKSDNDCLSMGTDVRTCFIPLQAVSQKKAVSAPIHGDSRRRAGQERPGVEKRGKVFCLEHPKQLLMKDPCLPQLGGDQAVGNDAEQALELENSCMLIGGAGQGKTTVCRRVLSEFIEAGSVELSDFKFVFYIPCREVERVKSEHWSVLLGLLHSNLKLDPEDQELVLEYLSSHSKEVLVILDGVDEAGSDGFGDASAALSLLNRHDDDSSNNSRLPDATVIVTSRPCLQAYDLVPKCVLHFQLTGFNDHQLKQFCYKHLGDEEGARLMEKLSEPSNLALKKAVCTTPLLAALLCQQCCADSPLPPSVTAFYTQFVHSSVVKLEKRRNKKFGRVQLAHDVDSQLCGGKTFTTGDLINIRTVLDYQLEDHIAETMGEGCDRDAVELVEALRQLYGLAFDGLCRGDLSFAPELLAPATLWLCANLGLVTNAGIEESHDPTKSQFSLIHRTVQEWCAARAASSSPECVGVLNGCVECIGVDEDSWPFWKFAFGSLKVGHVSDVLTTIQSAAPEAAAGRRSKRLHLFLMRCLLENELTVIGDTVSIDDDSSQDRDAETDSYKSAALCLTENGIDLDGEHLDSVDVMAVCATLELVDRVDTLVMSHCNLSEDHIADLSAVLDRGVEVNLTGNDLGGPPLAAIAESLSQSTRRNTVLLDMRNSGLTHGRQDGVSLSQCLQHESIKRLYVHGGDLGNAGLSGFAATLTRCDHVTELSVSQCALSDGCGDDLVTIIGLFPNLYALWLNDNQLTNRDVDVVLNALPSHEKFEFLTIASNLLDGEVVGSVKQFLRARRAFESESLADEARLPRCSIVATGDGMTEAFLQDVLASVDTADDVIDVCSHCLVKGNVRGGRVADLIEQGGGFLLGYAKDSIIPMLAEYFANDDEIVYLNVTQSQITNVGAIQLADEGLARNSRLLYVNLSRNRIQLDGVVAVLQALSSTQSAVRALIVEVNPVFAAVDRRSREYRHFCALLPDCKNLRFLSFEKTGMCDDIGQDILESLRHHQSLMWINLGGNHIADGTVSKLVDVVKDIPALKRVTLSNNRITDDGIRQLLKTNEVMAMEAVWLKFNPCSASLFEPPLFNSSFRYSDDYHGAGTNNIILDYIRAD